MVGLGWVVFLVANQFDFRAMWSCSASRAIVNKSTLRALCSVSRCPSRTNDRRTDQVRVISSSRWPLGSLK
jgi:hypothetical protein